MAPVPYVISNIVKGRQDKGHHTPQVGIAEAIGSQAVCAATEETKMKEMVAKIVEAFMITKRVVVVH